MSGSLYVQLLHLRYGVLSLTGASLTKMLVWLLSDLPIDWASQV